MNSVLLGVDDDPGFSFRNCRRNANLLAAGYKPPNVKKTGTTICGVIFQDGVVLGADTKATAGRICCDKKCEKLHYIQDNIYCAGAGTSADLEMTTRYVRQNMDLHRRNTNRKSVPMQAAVTFTKRYQFLYGGGISGYYIFGGVDREGPHIHAVHSYGSTDKVPYATFGSGSLAAMGVCEAGWRPDLTQEEAISLVHDAVHAGVYNDLGSGHGVDICVIKKGFHKVIRGVHVVKTVSERKLDYTFKRGVTGVAKKFEIEIINENTQDIPMEI